MTKEHAKLKNILFPPMLITDFIEKVFAGKTRKTGEPYVCHLYAVRDILIESGVEEQYILDAALLHDVLEDTSVTKEYLEQNFGKVVTFMVVMLSKEHVWHTSYCKLKSYMFSLENCAIYYPEIILVKMADRLHNLQTIGVFDLEKQKEYLRETEKYLFPIFKKSLRFTPQKKPFIFIYEQLEIQVASIQQNLLITYHTEYEYAV